MIRISGYHAPISPTGRRRRWAFWALAAVITLSMGTPVVSAATTYQEQRTFSASAGATVDVENLVGEVTVEGTASGDIEIVATIHAESGSLADAQTLLSSVVIEFNEDGNSVDVKVVFPVDRFDKFRYPQTGRGGSNNQTSYRNHRVTVTSRDDDDAVTLWVDIEIRVPPGIAADIENKVGNVSATGMQGEFNADTSSGDVTARDGRGDVSVDTGSGDVVIDNVTGEVSPDTGSGNIEMERVSGSIYADTGSGGTSAVPRRSAPIPAPATCRRSSRSRSTRARGTSN